MNQMSMEAKALSACLSSQVSYKPVHASTIVTSSKKGKKLMFGVS
jgi:hypothetical protein